MEMQAVDNKFALLESCCIELCNFGSMEKGGEFCPHCKCVILSWL